MSSYFCFHTSKNLIQQQIHATWTNQENDVANPMAMQIGQITSRGCSFIDVL